MMKYRATFRQPKAGLNPLGLSLSTPVTVEVFSIGKTERNFNARTIDDTGHALRVLNYDHSAAKISGPPDIVKRQVGLLFEEQLSAWESQEEAGLL